jgi:hypothetical protein
MKKEDFIKRGMSLEDVNKLFFLVSMAGNQNTRLCNGDPHHDNPNPSDKDKNAQLWESDFNRTVVRLEELVAPHGFTVLCDGIWPSFEIDGRTVFAEV